MVCLLSMGSDPTASIELLSKKNRLGRWRHVSIAGIMCFKIYFL